VYLIIPHDKCQMMRSHAVPTQSTTIVAVQLKGLETNMQTKTHSFIRVFCQEGIRVVRIRPLTMTPCVGQQQVIFVRQAFDRLVLLV
jgi:hypothetical protein